jgi:hypothetical protein
MNGGGPTFTAGQLAYNTMGHVDTAHNTNEILSFGGSNSSITNLSVLMCVALGPPLQATSGDDWDMMVVFTASGNYAAMQFNSQCAGAGTGWGVRLESGHPTTHSGCVFLPAQSTNLYSVNYNMTTGVETLYVYQTDGTPIGNATVNEATGTGDTLDDIYFGNNENGNNAGTTTYFQNILLNWATAPNPFFWTPG